jgi:hypothetical protein
MDGGFGPKLVDHVIDLETFFRHEILSAGCLRGL